MSLPQPQPACLGTGDAPQAHARARSSASDGSRGSGRWARGVACAALGTGLAGWLVAGSLRANPNSPVETPSPTMRVVQVTSEQPPATELALPATPTAELPTTATATPGPAQWSTLPPQGNRFRQRAPSLWPPASAGGAAAAPAASALPTSAVPSNTPPASDAHTSASSAGTLPVDDACLSAAATEAPAPETTAAAPGLLAPAPSIPIAAAGVAPSTAPTASAASANPAGVHLATGTLTGPTAAPIPTSSVASPARPVAYERESSPPAVYDASAPAVIGDPSAGTVLPAGGPLPPAAGAAPVQLAAEPALGPAAGEPGPPTRVVERDQNFSFEVLDHVAELPVMLHRSKLLRSPVDVYRIAVVDPAICDVNQFTPRELALIGRSQGATHVTFWFEDEQRPPVTYLVRVTPDVETQKRREDQYHLFEEILSELFPDSRIELVPVSDKLVVKGQAKDAEEAAHIMALVRHQAGGAGGAGGGGWGGGGGGWGGGWGFAGSVAEGLAAEPLVGQGAGGRMLPPSQVLNLLRIPGVQQVALRVKIAELNREKARRFGVDLDMRFEDGNVLLRSLLNVANGSAATVVGSFDANQINFGIHYLEREGVVRLLSEPTLVTLSGRQARFVAGGEFAVPTVVGVGGASAVTTDFRAFGAIIFFLPTVLDKDRIRLQVSPEFSELNRNNAVALAGGGSIPGLSTKAVSTTVEMREGQTLAIAGLLSDGMRADLSGNVPFLMRALGLRNIERKESELLILVTPELVHPLEPEEVPPLPGFDVTEPTNTEFFLMGRLEGRPTLEYRSTVWPRLRQRYQHGGPAMISGPFGHGK